MGDRTEKGVPMGRLNSLLFAFVLVGCSIKQPTWCYGAMAGEVVVIPDMESGTQSGVIKTAQFNAAATQANADRAFSKGHYDEAFGAYFAACDIDFPRSCYSAAHILDEQLLINAPIELYEQSLQIELYQTACLSNFQDSCERIETES